MKDEQRGSKLSTEVFDLICQPLAERSDQHLPFGVSDLLFEVIYGAGQDLNSNSGLVLRYLLSDKNKFQENQHF